MREIGFRRALPLALTFIHVVLVYGARPDHPRVVSATVSNPTYHSVAFQEGVALPVDPLGPPPLRPIQKAGFVLELPAMFMATLICAVLFPSNDSAWMYMSIPFVPLVWYVIGRWLDGLLEYGPRLSLPGILRRILSVPAVIVLCVSIVGLTPLYHHRTPDSNWAFTSMALWSALCLTMMASSARRLDD
jgi:hypothetical protein